MAAHNDPTVAPPKRRRSRETTEEALYATAARLFASHGYASTTLEQIATEVRVHKSTIFHYVDSKEHLLVTVLDRAFSRYLTSLQEISGEQSDSRIRLLTAIHNHLDFVFDHGTELRLFIRERHQLGSAEGRFYLDMTDRYEALFTKLIADGMRDGVIARADPTLTCRLLLGGANSIVEWFHSGGTLTRGEVVEHYLGLFIRKA